MSIVTFETEVPSSIPPAKLFAAMVDDGHTIMPKAVPHAFKGIDILEGDGGVGTVKQINFGDASPFKYVKERVEKVDRENFIFGVTVFESDSFEAKKVEKVYTEAKFEATPDGGCVVKGTSTIHTLQGFEPNEEDIKARKVMTMGMFKAVEAYLIANP